MGFTENLQGACHVFGIREDIAFILGENLITGGWHKQRALAADAYDHRAQGRKQVGQLAQRRVQDRTVVLELEPDEMDAAVEERLDRVRESLAAPDADASILISGERGWVRVCLMLLPIGRA